MIYNSIIKNFNLNVDLESKSAVLAFFAKDFAKNTNFTNQINEDKNYDMSIWEGNSLPDKSCNSLNRLVKLIGINADDSNDLTFKEDYENAFRGCTK